MKENDLRFVAIDEGQFFPGLYDLAFELIPQGYKLIVTGLVRGFNRAPFGDIPKLMCLADVVTYNYGVCVSCYSPATDSQRMKKMPTGAIPADYKDPLELIGGKDHDGVSYYYDARCISHWKLPGRPTSQFTFPKLSDSRIGLR